MISNPGHDVNSIYIKRQRLSSRHALIVFVAFEIYCLSELILSSNSQPIDFSCRLDGWGKFQLISGRPLVNHFRNSSSSA